MDHMSEKRASQRIEVEVPVYIGTKKATTRDISWTGIYFLAEDSFPEGDNVNFSIDLSYALPGQPIKLDCHGEVLRVEKYGDKFGVAAKINHFQYLH